MKDWILPSLIKIIKKEYSQTLNIFITIKATNLPIDEHPAKLTVQERRALIKEEAKKLL